MNVLLVEYYSQASKLKTNAKIHAEKKPYNCEICNKSFSQAEHLKTHTKIHTGEKLYILKQ